MNNKHFFITLAANNIRKNGKFYIPYILAFIGTVAMYYNMSAITYSKGMEKLPGSDSLISMLKFGITVVGIFAVIFLFYTNSFVIRQRKKEFGLYNILGMEKRHVAKVLFIESVMVAAMGIGGGLIVGVIFNKLVMLLLLNIMRAEISIKFTLVPHSVISVAVLFGLICIATFIANEIQLVKTKPIDLLHGGNIGEREPKTKWIMTILGLICLGSGYGIAITVKSPLSAITLFFIAVILVIFGTYFLFIAGSIALLKLLRKNKKYYYQTKHFTSVSGMLYRMKQNAVGLASICILSTMVLVMVSTTICLYSGVEDALNTRFTHELSAYGYVDENIDEAKVNEVMNQAVTESGCKVKNQVSYFYLSFAGAADENGYTFNSDNYLNSSNMHEFVLITAEEYNKIANEKITLSDNEVYAYDSDEKTLENFKLFNEEFKVVKYLDDFDIISADAGFMVNIHYIVVANDTVLNEIQKQEMEAYPDSYNVIQYEMDLDVEGTADEKIAAYNIANDAFINAEDGLSVHVEGREATRTDFYAMYGGFLFLGIFLGFLFVMATVLIIYYKQISEGYDDKERFQIMQKVGMSKKEVRASIRSQVLTVFFLPLVTAALHVTMAFPMIKKLLHLLNLSNTDLFIWCMIGTVLAFTVVYAIVYSLTSKAYYKIVE